MLFYTGHLPDLNFRACLGICQLFSYEQFQSQIPKQALNVFFLFSRTLYGKWKTLAVTARVF